MEVESMVNVIETQGLSKDYGRVQAVRGLDLTVAPGEVYGLLGLNGAGKTTTVRMLTGGLAPPGGRARVCGVDVVGEPKQVASRVGVVFGENLAPEPSFSPVRYLRYVGGLYGLSRREVDKRARLLFDVLALEAFAERPVGALSGGNRRKVELARALLHAPDVVFLDEPTRELDIPAKRAMWSFLRDLVSDGKVTVFLSSHDVQEIAALCTRIGILRQGVKVWEGAPSALTSGGEGLVEALAERLEGRNVRFGPAQGGP